MTTEMPSNDHASRKSGLWKKAAVLAAAVVVAAVAFVRFGNQLSLAELAEQEASLRAYQQAQPVLVYGMASVVYVLVTGLSLPGAAAMSLMIGWYCGVVDGVILVSFASTTGATMAFLLSRFVLRDSIQSKFGDRLAAFNEALEREGAFYLFTLRLIPAVPFFVINVVMGLTPIRTRTFWWVSQIGMLPATIVYVYAGSSVPDLKTLADQGTSGILSPRLFVAFVLLGLFPIVVKKLVARFGARSDVPSAAD